MATIAVRWLAEDGADATHAYRPFIEDGHEVVLRGAGKDIVAVDERKSPPMSAAPRGPAQGGVKRGVCVATEALGRDRMCRLKNAVENTAVGGDDNCHVHTILKCSFCRARCGCCVACAAVATVLKQIAVALRSRATLKPAEADVAQETSE
jgi:hypothetical protein